MNLNTPLSQLSPEMRLLLNACRLLCDEEALQSLEGILHEKLNWNEVLQKANYHGVAPILYHTLNKFQHNGEVPDRVLSSLQLVYKRTAYFNLNLLKAICRWVEPMMKTFK